MSLGWGRVVPGVAVAGFLVFAALGSSTPPRVVPDALSFCFELATVSTPLEGAALEILEEDGRAHCRTCAADFSLTDPFLLCDCGSADVELLSGRQLSVMSVEVA